MGAGAIFSAQPKGMGRKGEMSLRIVEYDRPHRLHNVVRSAYMEVDGTVTFGETAGGTRLKDYVESGPR